MQIEVENLTQSVKRFTRTYATSELPLGDEDVRLLEKVEVRGSATRKGGRVSLSGEIKTKVEKPCDRCLGLVGLPIDATFEAKFVPLDEEAARESPVLEAEDLDVSVLEDSVIDVDDVVREQILLAADARTLCREDCRGLCPSCGANLNDRQCACVESEVDPRWALLSALRDKRQEP